MRTKHRPINYTLHFEQISQTAHTIQCECSSNQHTQHARWKRKNRITQMKAIIARLKAENVYLRHEIELIADCLQLKGDKQ